jgi:hypothetical protein
MDKLGRPAHLPQRPTPSELGTALERPIAEECHCEAAEHPRKSTELRRNDATRTTGGHSRPDSTSATIEAAKETPRSSAQSGRKPLVSFQTKAEKAQVTTDEEGGKVGEKFLACQGLLGRDSGLTGIAIVARSVFRQPFFVSSFFSTMAYLVFRNDGQWACVAAAVTALIFSW